MIKTGLLSALDELGFRVRFIWNYKSTKKCDLACWDPHLFLIKNSQITVVFW